VPLGHDRANPAQAEKDGGGQAGQAAADNQDRAVLVLPGPVIIAAVVAVRVDNSLPGRGGTDSYRSMHQKF
jgi:hypothetical protein